MREWQPTPVFLPEKSHRERSLAGFDSQGCKELDMIEHTYTMGMLILASQASRD